MNFDPQKFFIGLMDFFTILMPGALLTFLLMDEGGKAVLGDRYVILSGTEGWAVFLFASYLLGHFIFLLSSTLDFFYDWARRYTLDTQIRLLALRSRLLPWPFRVAIWLAFKEERNLAVHHAGKIKRHYLSKLQAADAINTFQWSKAFLNVEHSESLAGVQRFEADSKFFRCFSIVLLILLLFWPWLEKWSGSGIFIVLGLLLLALWRYMEQRLKATNQAYRAVITYCAKEGKITVPSQSSAPDNVTHAGGVVFRIHNGLVQYLLVEAQKDPDHWVLPKGHIETGEDPRETAVREVREESGVWAEIRADLPLTSYSVANSMITVRYYLMRAVGKGIRSEPFRRHEWLSLQDAVSRATHSETRELLQKAEQLRRESPQRPPD